MDTFIVGISFMSGMLFLTSLAVVFRLMHADRVIPWIVRMYCLWGLLGAAYFFTALDPAYSAQTPILAGFVAMELLYLLSVLVFIFGIFSVMEASLTIRFLSEIASCGSRGVELPELMRRYNKTTIIRRRIQRLMVAGDIEKTYQGYVIGKRMSYFQLRELVFDAMRMLFPTKNV